MHSARNSPRPSSVTERSPNPGGFQGAAPGTPGACQVQKARFPRATPVAKGRVARVTGSAPRAIPVNSRGARPGLPRRLVRALAGFGQLRGGWSSFLPHPHPHLREAGEFSEASRYQGPCCGPKGGRASQHFPCWPGARQDLAVAGKNLLLVYVRRPNGQALWPGAGGLGSTLGGLGTSASAPLDLQRPICEMGKSNMCVTSCRRGPRSQETK